jgi:hypothetical protein
MVPGQVNPQQTVPAILRHQVEQWQAITGKPPSDKIVYLFYQHAQGKDVAKTIEVELGLAMNAKEDAENVRADALHPLDMESERALARQRNASAAKTENAPAAQSPEDKKQLAEEKIRRAEVSKLESRARLLSAKYQAQLASEDKKTNAKAVETGAELVAVKNQIRALKGQPSPTAPQASPAITDDPLGIN